MYLSFKVSSSLMLLCMYIGGGLLIRDFMVMELIVGVFFWEYCCVIHVGFCVSVSIIMFFI